MTDPEPPVVRNITDLARLAGVSPGTVSRALAGKALVNAETRARIEALAAQHGFRPNQMASRLRTRRAGAIGVVVPLGHDRRQHLSDPFFMAMLAPLADRLTEGGYDVMLSRIIPDADDWLERIVDSGMLDGVLLIGQSDQQHAIDRVAARYRPLVVWGSAEAGRAAGVCTIGTDNRAGGRLAAERLIARGCRHLAFLGETGSPEPRERFEGAADAAREAGLDPLLMLRVPMASDGLEERVAARIDAADTPIDGIVAASDVIALTTLRVLADRGIAVPGRIAVTGYDDLPLASQAVPRITTVRQDIAKGAAAMVDALLRRIAGEAAPGMVMAPELIVRDTA